MKLIAKYGYPIGTRLMGADEVLFINWAYEEEPPMALPLSASDEPDRYYIQLYHTVATQVPLEGKDVLEVSCGHGGGSSYLVRTQKPASYTGLDLNPTGIKFCRKRHNLPGLEFVQGDAEKLPFPDESVDVVLNIEASHHYPNIARFFTEVARVLRPGGHFLYADLRAVHLVPEWEAQLEAAPLQLVSQRGIDDEVKRGLEKNSPRLEELINRRVPKVLRKFARSNGGVQGGRLYRGVEMGLFSYRVYCFTKASADA
ncbi:SAM-dependent methyltransferase [Mycobacterium asiaticum]|uniref:SAM-dependent methyltransferase n=1 Tax=Mycobacterium asiaticum TaxID=1790 RepID=A0A1A3P331_MYCAS|nr:class I SAM-dependent methyltransferase [Mycobacterium asiaticum]OBK26992.1 SAM-dependent methyltransferase [Mycobacterium asiaticum]